MPETPTTEAGRRFIAAELDGQVYITDILFIEAEARQQERERLRAEVEALWDQANAIYLGGWNGALSAVLALLADPAEPEESGDA